MEVRQEAAMTVTRLDFYIEYTLELAWLHYAQHQYAPGYIRQVWEGWGIEDFEN